MGASCFRGAAKEEVKKSSATNDEVHANTESQKVVNEYSDNQKGHGKIRDSPSTPQMLRRFRFSELQVATDHFKDSNLLGEGGFGRVYRGWLDLPDPESENPEELKSFQVAVKRLNPSGFQGYEEWLMEVLMLERLQHPNLVRLVGYCAELGEALLVYEYLPGGSLDRVLFHEVYGKVLSWEMRMQIAVDAASGLAYLHDNNVIHRDFKAPNILLDENSRGKITDFGLARAGPGNDQTHVSTRVVGTLGYVDPTYMETGQLTLKTDVYAFGVVLLELLTGRRTMGDDGKWSLTDWVKPYLSTRKPDLNLLVDERLGEDYNKKAASKLAILAKHCIHAEPLARPEMGDLVKTLKLIKGPNYDG